MISIFVASVVTEFFFTDKISEQKQQRGFQLETLVEIVAGVFLDQSSQHGLGLNTVSERKENIIFSAVFFSEEV